MMHAKLEVTMVLEHQSHQMCYGMATIKENNSSQQETRATKLFQKTLQLCLC